MQGQLENCELFCKTEDEGVICSCAAGYALGNDNKTCTPIATMPHLKFIPGAHITSWPHLGSAGVLQCHCSIMLTSCLSHGLLEVLPTNLIRS